MEIFARVKCVNVDKNGWFCLIFGIICRKLHLNAEINQRFNQRLFSTLKYEIVFVFSVLNWTERSKIVKKLTNT